MAAYAFLIRLGRECFLFVSKFISVTEGFQPRQPRVLQTVSRARPDVRAISMSGWRSCVDAHATPPVKAAIAARSRALASRQASVRLARASYLRPQAVAAAIAVSRSRSGSGPT